MTIRPARPGEAAALSELARRSKAHWGYDEGFLDACRADLTLSPDDIRARRTTVASTAIAGRALPRLHVRLDSLTR
ncbi:hypothetical protein [Actinoplanes sp. NPDC026619]|uniref:hypothetical protein n=1 Tax=Actinoplanes sp. NPDC026619 TaxID=3155798 RepID=UPI0033C98D0A